MSQEPDIDPNDDRALAVLDEFPFDTTPPADLVKRGIAIVEGAGPAPVAPGARTWAWLLTGAAAIAAFLLAAWGLGPTALAQPALKCASIELGTALAAWALVRAYLRRREGELMPSTGALTAAAGALGGSLYLHVACTDHHAAHLFVAHALTVSVAAGLGALAARWLGRAALV